MPDVLSHRYASQVKRHLLRSFALGHSRVSQTLLITGRPGIGKTFQLSLALRLYEVEAVSFDAMMIESGRANDPVKELSRIVGEVATANISGQPTALILDDADLLLGRFDLTQYTHNLQHVTQELMRISQGDGRRVPMFMLANDSSLVHAPLLRQGRARHFHWEPHTVEVESVVATMFPLLSEVEVTALVGTFPLQPVAFYSELRDGLLDSFWDLNYVGSQVAAALTRMSRSPQASIPEVQYQVSDLIRLGETLIASR